MMSGVRAKNTRPELLVRSGLHRRGHRFVLHDKRLPGAPDIVFPKHRAVILVHGCFWHGHECGLFKWPKTRVDFWRAKIETNQVRDATTHLKLLASGWRVGAVWECALKSNDTGKLNSVLDKCHEWLLSSDPELEVIG